MKRRMTKGWGENDVFTDWRRHYSYTQRRGVCAWIKRNARRRERREGKREAREQ
jgi:hypothetical protein